uniref:Uncharacterized protein n=1 Tax=Cacopsylla melanoneura TaxID=428564 RepID=A0A8D8VCS0_9HEMI
MFLKYKKKYCWKKKKNQKHVALSVFTRNFRIFNHFNIISVTNYSTELLTLTLKSRASGTGAQCGHYCVLCSYIGSYHRAISKCWREPIPIAKQPQPLCALLLKSWLQNNI